MSDKTTIGFVTRSDDGVHILDSVVFQLWAWGVFVGIVISIIQSSIVPIVLGCWVGLLIGLIVSELMGIGAHRGPIRIVDRK